MQWVNNSVTPNIDFNQLFPYHMKFNNNFYSFKKSIQK